MLKKAVVLCFIGLLTIGFLSVLGSTEKIDSVPNVKSAPIFHPKPSHYYATSIRINSDSDFNAQFSNRTIWNLEINGMGKGFCIFIGNCSQPFTVKNCYLYNASGAYYLWNSGVYLYKSSNGTLLNNYCGENLCGIGLESSSTNTLTSNNCNGNYGDGVYLTGSGRGNLVNYNNIYSNGGNGIDIYPSSSNTISYNCISSNSYYGIEIYQSSSNTISYNNISSNYNYGISILMASQSNVIHHNNFVNNHGASTIYNSAHVQVSDMAGSNLWYSSTEGNHWSDWTSPDANHNGIVDHPYGIDGTANANDPYPLVNPVPGAGVPVPETSLPTPLNIICAMLLTAIVARRRRGRSVSSVPP